jgi:hypothetical protein
MNCQSKDVWYGMAGWNNRDPFPRITQQTSSQHFKIGFEKQRKKKSLQLLLVTNYTTNQPRKS